MFEIQVQKVLINGIEKFECKFNSVNHKMNVMYIVGNRFSATEQKANNVLAQDIMRCI